MILSSVKLLCISHKGETVKLVRGTNVTTLSNYNMVRDIYDSNLKFTNNRINSVITSFLNKDRSIYNMSDNRVLIVYKNIICIYSLRDRKLHKINYPVIISDYMFHRNKATNICYLTITYNDGFDIFMIDNLHYVFKQVRIPRLQDRHYTILGIEKRNFIIISSENEIQLYELKIDELKLLITIQEGNKFMAGVLRDKVYIIVEDKNIYICNVDDNTIEYCYRSPRSRYLINMNDKIYRTIEKEEGITITTFDYDSDKKTAAISSIDVTMEFLPNKYMLLSPSILLTINDLTNHIVIFDMNKNSLLLDQETNEKAANLTTMTYNQFIYGFTLFTINYNDKTITETSLEMSIPLFELQNSEEERMKLNIIILSRNINNLISKFI